VYLIAKPAPQAAQNGAAGPRAAALVAVEVTRVTRATLRDAIQFTKRALNQWLLQAGPIFDHSLALEMLGFFSDDMRAGIDGLRRKQRPSIRRAP
jgi:hypothetical protein